MKAFINPEGTLIVQPENSTEAYALGQWSDHPDNMAARMIVETKVKKQEFRVPEFHTTPSGEVLYGDHRPLRANIDDFHIQP